MLNSEEKVSGFFSQRIDSRSLYVTIKNK